MIRYGYLPHGWSWLDLKRNNDADVVKNKLLTDYTIPVTPFEETNPAAKPCVLNQNDFLTLLIKNTI